MIHLDVGCTVFGSCGPRLALMTMRGTHMELRTLRSFLTVAREANVTRAARVLHITQPALSRQLAELERDLGCELFVRESRGMTLTDDGILLRKRAEEIVSLADRTEAELRSPSVEIEGDVWVGGGESRVMEIVARAAHTIGVEHPGVRLRLYSGNGMDVMERVDKGLLDFGIVMGVETPSRYEMLDLGWEDGWGLLMRSGHPLATRDVLHMSDIANEPLIVSAQTVAELEADNAAMGRFSEGSLHVVATYTLLYNASLFVEQGVGSALCFDGIIPAGEGTPFTFVPVEGMPPVPSRLVWKRAQPLSRACSLFLGTMRSLVTDAER